MPVNPIEAAQRLAATGQIPAAIEHLRSAGAGGDAAALAELATWYLAAVTVPRDLAAARALLRRAVEIGHVDAALSEVSLTANGSGAPADWKGAVALLEHAARSDPLAAEQLGLLASMKVDEHGLPFGLPLPERIAATPRVTRFAGFCTPQECVHIASIAAPALQPATIFDPASGQMVLNPIRISDNAPIGPTQESLPVQAINRRIAAATDTDVMQGEPLTVLRYGPGQQYRPHLDTLPHGDNQRVLTAILYLNDSYEGGETQFPLLGITVVPRAGDLLVFENVDARGAPATHSRHAGLPVKSGTKWIATRWIRARATTAWELSDQARADART
jgi:prolyl 4-hydroxylase